MLTFILGKVVLEKLLYSCSNFKRIYILIRTKSKLLPLTPKKTPPFTSGSRRRSSTPDALIDAEETSPGSINLLDRDSSQLEETS